jgi:hypothetical protein
MFFRMDPMPVVPLASINLPNNDPATIAQVCGPRVRSLRTVCVCVCGVCILGVRVSVSVHASVCPCVSVVCL